MHENYKNLLESDYRKEYIREVRKFVIVRLFITERLD